MKVVYTLGIYGLRMVMNLMALGNTKVRKGITGRKDNAEILKQLNPEKPRIWMHCASLGEYEMGAPLLEKLKLEYPSYQFVITFFSPSGYERIKATSKDVILYLPFDLPKLQESFVESINPELVIFVKYEYWYHLIHILSERNIPQIFISSLFTPKKIFFQSYGKWFLKQLQQIDHFFVQNSSSQKCLLDHGISEVTIAGDTRMERVKENANLPKEFPKIAEFKNGFPLIIGGSIWEKGEACFLTFLRENPNSNAKIILAPHEINSQKINRLRRKLEEVISPKEIALWSELNEQSDLSTYRVLVIDQIGLLKYLYQYADVAYVGGGFKKGGLHNILESAVFGNALLIGPEFSRFPEALEMQKKNALISIQSPLGFSETLEELLQNSEKLSELQNNSKEYVYSKPNAVAVIYNEILKKGWLDRS